MKNETITQMITAYRACNTYHDTGFIVASNELSWLDGLTFRTAFEKPDRFMFEITGGDNQQSRRVVWRNGNSIFLYLDGECSKETDFSLAIKRACGYGFPCYVIPLLTDELEMPEIFCNEFTALQQNSELPSEIELTAQCLPWAKLSLNVETETYLLRKVATKTCDIGQSPRSVQCVFLESEFDATLPAEIFAFSSSVGL
jgi:hypothetical protein